MSNSESQLKELRINFSGRGRAFVLFRVALQLLLFGKAQLNVRSSRVSETTRHSYEDLPQEARNHFDAAFTKADAAFKSMHDGFESLKTTKKGR